MKRFIFALVLTSSVTPAVAINCIKELTQLSKEVLLDIDSYSKFESFMIEQISQMRTLGERGDKGFKEYAYNAPVNIVAKNLISTSYAQNNYFPGEVGRLEKMIILVTQLYRVKNSYHISTGHTLPLDAALVKKLKTTPIEWRGQLAEAMQIEVANPSARGTVLKGEDLASDIIRFNAEYNQSVSIDDLIIYGNARLRLEALESEILEGSSEAANSTQEMANSAQNTSTASQPATATNNTPWALEKIQPQTLAELTKLETLLLNVNMRLNDPTDLKNLAIDYVNTFNISDFNYLKFNSSPTKINFELERFAKIAISNFRNFWQVKDNHKATADFTKVLEQAMNWRLGVVTTQQRDLKIDMNSLNNYIKSITFDEINF